MRATCSGRLALAARANMHSPIECLNCTRYKRALYGRGTLATARLPRLLAVLRLPSRSRNFTLLLHFARRPALLVPPDPLQPGWRDRRRLCPLQPLQGPPTCAMAPPGLCPPEAASSSSPVSVGIGLEPDPLLTPGDSDRRPSPGSKCARRCLSVRAPPGRWKQPPLETETLGGLPVRLDTDPELPSSLSRTESFCCRAARAWPGPLLPLQRLSQPSPRRPTSASLTWSASAVCRRCSASGAVDVTAAIAEPVVAPSCGSDLIERRSPGDCRHCPPRAAASTPPGEEGAPSFASDGLCAPCRSPAAPLLRRHRCCAQHRVLRARLSLRPESAIPPRQSASSVVGLSAPPAIAAAGVLAAAAARHQTPSFRGRRGSPPTGF